MILLLEAGVVRIQRAGVVRLQREWIARLQTAEVVPLQRSEVIRSHNTKAIRPRGVGVVRLTEGGVVHLREAEDVTDPEASTATTTDTPPAPDIVFERLAGIAMERALEVALVMEITTIALHHEMRPPVPRTRWPPNTLRPQIQDSVLASVLKMDVREYITSPPNTTPRHFETRMTYASS